MNTPNAKPAEPPAKRYEKPAVIHREKMDVLAVVCDSAWVPNRQCRLQGTGSCVKIRL